jgi:2'-5' RNA ligase superfamily
MAHFLLLVPVPEVEPLVAKLRARFDPSARRGLGAHITVLHSDMQSEHVDPMAVERIAAAVSGLAPFDYWITQVDRFPGTLYLAAAPAAPFVLLSERLNAALATSEREEHGREPLIPHVSVVRKSAIDDCEVEAELRGMLERHAPISCLCKEIVLFENSSGVWRPVREFPLNGDTGSPGQAPF